MLDLPGKIRHTTFMNTLFRRAVKTGARLRFAVCGPSGCGKTYTLLKLATELGGPVAFIDTEHGSASKYADLFEFDVLELDSFDPLHLIRLIREAANAGYRVLCIDSLSHFWMGKNGALDQVDRISKSSGNSFAAWRQVTPIHNALIEAIIAAPFHILASMRAKTEWILEREEKPAKRFLARLDSPRSCGMASSTSLISAAKWIRRTHLSSPRRAVPPSLVRSSTNLARNSRLHSNSGWMLRQPTLPFQRQLWNSRSPNRSPGLLFNPKMAPFRKACCRCGSACANRDR